MPSTDALANWLHLTLAPGIGSETQRRLLADFGLPDHIFAASVATLGRTVPLQQAERLLAHDSGSEIAMALSWAAQPGNCILTLADAAYPQRLLDTPDPPTVLFVKGRTDLLNAPALAIVGSRNATPQGEANAEAFAAALADAGLTVVSGMALGIDAAAHRGGLRGPGPTIRDRYRHRSRLPGTQPGAGTRYRRQGRHRQRIPARQAGAEGKFSAPQPHHQKFVQSAGLETFDAAKHQYLVWLGCAGAFEADFQRSLRALFEVLRARGVTFGVLAKERCTGDLAKRAGNEYVFQELATQNIEDFRAAGVTKIITSCPHCLKTIGHDYGMFGFKAEVVHSSVLVESLTRDVRLEGHESVTFHDPCYLGRYAGHHEEPRALLARVGAEIVEPTHAIPVTGVTVRARDNPFCCGAGGGLLFEEHEAGKRISQERFEQLQATGTGKIVMACPFCSIMLKGAQASSNAAVEMVDLMVYVDGALKAAQDGAPGRPGTGTATGA